MMQDGTWKVTHAAAGNLSDFSLPSPPKSRFKAVFKYTPGAALDFSVEQVVLFRAWSSHFKCTGK